MDLFPAGHEVGAEDVALAPDGTLYATGVTHAVVGEVNFGHSDFYVRRYAADGTLLLSRQYGTAGFDRGESVVVDQSGNVYVAGATTGQFPGAPHNDNLDAFVAKLAPDGGLIWLRQFPSPAADAFGEVVVGEDGKAYLTWRSGEAGALWKLTPRGSVSWRRSLPGRPSSLYTRGRRVYTVLSAGLSSELAAFEFSGERVWSKVFTSPAAVGQVAVAPPPIGSSRLARTPPARGR
jgi:hypothetical protein